MPNSRISERSRNAATDISMRRSSRSGLAFNRQKTLKAAIGRIDEDDEVHAQPSGEYDYLLHFERAPERLRFCTGQSLEAQFAAMLGYEDLLVDRLREAAPSDSDELLLRNSTPPPSLMQKFSVGRGALDRRSTVWSRPPPVRAARSILLNDSISSRVDAKRSTTHISFAPKETRVNRARSSMLSELRDSRSDSDMLQLPTFKHQQMVSYQLENAMDLLDSLSVKQRRKMVTSKRHLTRDFKDPLQTYSAWSAVWPSLFTYSRRPNPELNNSLGTKSNVGEVSDVFLQSFVSGQYLQ